MMHIDFNAASLVVVLAAGHFVNTFATWLMHYLQHRRLFGVVFQRIHLRAHHDAKLKRSNPLLYRWWAFVGHLQWLAMIGVLAGIYFSLLVPWAAAAVLSEGLVMGAFTYYFHHQYDRPGSWLDRFAWFRRARRLHGIHHGRFESFGRSRNYAIGGPLTGFLADRVLGTFQGAGRGE